MAKIKHFIISIEVQAIHEIEVDCTSEDKAIKLAKEIIAEGNSEPIDEVVEVVDIYETELEDE
jgi:hypothetical protein